MIKEKLPENAETKFVENLIYEVRGMHVMLDVDVALCFHVTTKRLNEQMRRNKERFPNDFCFKLNQEELKQILRSQNATTSNLSSKRRYNPFVYTEHGIIALAGMLKNINESQKHIYIF